MPRKMLRPPVKLRKKFAALISKCRELVLTAPPQTSGTAIGDKLITIVIKLAVQDGIIVYPARNFPQGVTVEKGDGWVVVKYDVKRLLVWFKARAYTTYDAADLFTQRLPIMMRLCKMELKLDRMLGGVDVELGQQCDETTQFGSVS